ncbi:peptide-methionine (S)-S-oxide reductase MsrA [soil metagenome]
MVNTKFQTAVFGGGCFWCTEAVFSKLKGVENVISGYAGGKIPNPTYFQVSEELTGHAEVVKMDFDPSIITYNQLLDIFWHVHDPTTMNQQGADVGTQYRSIILYTNDEQKKDAEAMLAHLRETNEFKAPVVTQIQKMDAFYTAEEYHQKYYENNESQPYCEIVINPKIQKFLKKYASLTR